MCYSTQHCEQNTWLTCVFMCYSSQEKNTRVKTSIFWVNFNTVLCWVTHKIHVLTQVFFHNCLLGYGISPISDINQYIV